MYTYYFRPVFLWSTSRFDGDHGTGVARHRVDDESKIMNFNWMPSPNDNNLCIKLWKTIWNILYGSPSCSLLVMGRLGWSSWRYHDGACAPNRKWGSIKRYVPIVSCLTILKIFRVCLLVCSSAKRKSQNEKGGRADSLLPRVRRELFGKIWLMFLSLVPPPWSIAFAC
jgi:hypothetical protein